MKVRPEMGIFEFTGVATVRMVLALLLVLRLEIQKLFTNEQLKYKH